MSSLSSLSSHYIVDLQEEDKKQPKPMVRSIHLNAHRSQSQFPLYKILIVVCVFFFVVQFQLSRQLTSTDLSFEPSHDQQQSKSQSKSQSNSNSNSNSNSKFKFKLESYHSTEHRTQKKRSQSPLQSDTQGHDVTEVDADTDADADHIIVDDTARSAEARHDDTNTPAATVHTSASGLGNEEHGIHQELPSQNVAVPVPKTNNTMAACLFLMDDTIRLMEWLAYHMTVLPLGHLVVAIDPKSKQQDRILEILDQYRPFFRIDAHTNDTWLTLGPEEGWGRQVFYPNGGYRHWFVDREGDLYKAQAHKRRQNFFFSYCLQSLFHANTRTWTILIDSDEFLVYNYRHAEAENASIYDAVTKIITREHLDQARARVLPVRDALPRFHDEITIADYLNHYFQNMSTEEKVDLQLLPPSKRAAYKIQAMKDHALETSGIKLDRRPRCLRFPHLRFSSYESDPALVNDTSVVPSGVDPYTLMTLRQRKVGPMEGSFSKAMLDLSQAKSAEWFNFKGVVNVHTPSRRMCGRTSKENFSGSGTDYMSSLFRVNHYRSGTIETYLERGGDYRGSSIWRFYAERNILPESENDDIRPWIHWYIHKVGYTQARKLLLDPMAEAYRFYQRNAAYKTAIEALTRLQGDDPLEHGALNREVVKYNYTKTNHTMAACLFIKNDRMMLAEWIAYHYTVLPLGALVIGIDAQSVQEAHIKEIVQRWNHLIQIKVWSKDEWLKSIDESEGLRSKRWYADFSPETKMNMRREHVFLGECLSHHHQTGQNWTVVVAPDEFVTFNYKGKEENPVQFDAREEKVRTKEDIIEARTETSPIRDRLPPLQDRITIADFLFDNETTSVHKCLVMPGLQIGPRLFPVDDKPIAKDLLTLRQRQFGLKGGRWTRSILDVSKTTEFGWREVDSKRNPNLKLCPPNGRFEATDYIAALIRFHRYRIGSLETFFEHHESGGDAKHNNDDLVMAMYKNATEEFEPFGEDHTSVVPWFDWFVHKVGEKAAKELLLEPLVQAKAEILKKHKIIKEKEEESASGAGEE